MTVLEIALTIFEMFTFLAKIWNVPTKDALRIFLVVVEYG